MEKGIIVIGASIAGVFTVKELRKQGYEGKITLIDQQSDLPYDLLPLSKEWMLDEDNFDAPLLQKEAAYEEANINLKLNTKVISFDPAKKTILTEAGETISYDKLVLAIGSELRNLGAPGEHADGVFYLRDFQNAVKIKQWAKTAQELVIVGAGFIALEMASTFSQLGLNVTMLVRSGSPLEKIIGRDASDYFVRMHESHGVKILTHEEVEQFNLDEANLLTSVTTKSGKEIKCQMAIIGIGVVPNISLDHRDLKVDKGILVNEFGETSLPDVFAVGDCVIWPYQDEPIHIEHWEHAFNHGKAVAKNIVNAKSHPYTTRPYFWTDEYDQTFEYLGHAPTWDREIIRGSLDSRQFTIAYVDENNYPLAILFANKGDKRKEVTAFLNRNIPINEETFVDISIPLSEQ